MDGVAVGMHGVLGLAALQLHSAAAELSTWMASKKPHALRTQAPAALWITALALHWQP